MYTSHRYIYSEFIAIISTQFPMTPAKHHYSKMCFFLFWLSPPLTILQNSDSISFSSSSQYSHSPLPTVDMQCSGILSWITQ